MKKYLLTAKLGVNRFFALRVQMLLWTIISTVSPLFMMFLFRNLETGADRDYATMYFFFAMLVRLGTIVFVDSVISEFIYSGQLSFYLIKPVSFINSMIASFSAGQGMRILLALPLMAGAVFYFVNHGMLTTLTAGRIILFAGSIAGGYLISILMCLLVGIGTFWFERIWFLFDLNMAATLIFSGVSIPLRIFPDNVRAILDVLPFRYVLSFQLEILLDDKLPSVASFLIFFFYIVFWYVLVNFLYRKGLKKYTAFGN